VGWHPSWPARQWPGLRHAFSVAASALRFWEARLLSHGVTPTHTSRFGDDVLTFTDPDGLILELVATAETDNRVGYSHAEIPSTHTIRGFHGVTIAVIDAARTQTLLAGTMGYHVTRAEGGRTRFAASGAGGPSTYVDLLVDTSLPRGLQGAGTVHHLAFQTPDDATQAIARETLVDLGYHVSPVMDRNYFHSIYYREPEGVLFEIATNNPGFTVDEPAETLGESLKLPAQYESDRASIEATLPKLN
jgi:glyoxalase family protein